MLKNNLLCPWSNDEILLNIRDLIEEKIGIFIPDDRLPKLTSALIKFLNTSGNLSFIDCYKLMSSGSREGALLLNKIIPLITISETYFFRNSSDINTLKKYILPELINKHRNSSKTLRVWSAGCASGEEAYSLAISIFELIPDIESWNIFVLGSDIDSEALENARKGIYKKWALREVHDDTIRKYFSQKNDTFELKERYKQMVTFQCINLCDDFYISHNYLISNMDLILCKNVTLYFRSVTTKRIIDNFYNALSDGGYLIMGHADHSSEYCKRFILKTFPDSLVYHKLRQEDSQKIGLYSFDPINIIPFRENTLPPREVKIELRRKNCKETSIFEDAYQFMLRCEYDRAIDHFAKVLKINSLNSRACYMTACILANRGELKEAAAWCNRALRVNPLFSEAYYLLSLLQLNSNNIDASISLLKKVLYINPKSVLAYIQLGYIYRKRGVCKTSIKMFQNARYLLLNMDPAETVVKGEGIIAGNLLSMLDALLMEAG